MAPSREPLEARLLPDPPQERPRSGGRGWLAAASAFVLLVACFAALLWGLGKLLVSAGSVRPERGDALVGRWESSEERLAHVRAALEASEVGLSAVEQREVRRFLDKLGESLQPSSESSYVALVDLEACAERVLRHPASKSRSRTERRIIEQQFQHRVRPPAAWTDLTLVSAQRSKNGEELVVYAIASGFELPPEPVRWWLQRAGRSWRICDWERIDCGLSETARWALEGSQSSAGQASYKQAIETIHRAEGNADTGHMALAARELLDAQALEIPADLHDLVQIELARAWEKCARSDQMLAACGRVRNATANPGLHYHAALAYARRENFSAAIAAAQKYRAAAGRHPHLLEVQATALEAVGRRREAAQCWRERLALIPEDTDALAEYCRLAMEDDAGQAIALLKRTRRPAEFAIQTARSASYGHDDATVRVIERFFRETQPQSAALDLLAGLRLENGGQFAAAAPHFLAAAKKSAGPQERQDYLRQYLHAMALAGRAAQGYQAVDDPVWALQQLTAGLEYGEAAITIDDLPRLTALHRVRMPGDPRLIYLEGLVAMQDGDWPRAEAKFQAALAKAAAVSPADEDGPDFAARCRSKLQEARYKSGGLAAAYAAAPADESFRELARLCQDERNWSGLDELIALHRRQKPADPWIDYFLALRAEANGDSLAALTAVQRAEASGDAALTQTVHWLKNQLLIDSGGIAQAYHGSSDQREAFRRLVTHLSSQEDWDGVLELAELHASLAPRRSATLYWAVAAHWHRGEYQQVVDRLTPWPEDRVARLEPGQLTELCELLVRSLVRLGRLDDAEFAVERARDEYGVDPPQVALILARNDRPALLELLSHPRIARSLFERPLYRDRDLAPLLFDADLAEIRRTQALPLPRDRGSHNLALVLLFAEPLTAQQLQQSLDQAQAAGDAVAIDPWQDRWARMWDRGHEALVMACGAGEYCGCDALPENLAAGDSRRTILEQHGGWVALDLLTGEQRNAGSGLPAIATRLGRALAELKPLALYSSGSRTNHVELMDAQSHQRLISGAYFDPQRQAAAASGQLAAAGEIWPLYSGGGEYDFASWPARGKSLRQLADRARVENDAGHALARVTFTRGHAVEQHWLKVVRARPGKYSDDEFIAEMTADSKLWPFLRTGERLRLSSYELLEVRSLDADVSAAAGPSK
jgi:hypothetical protein